MDKATAGRAGALLNIITSHEDFLKHFKNQDKGNAGNRISFMESDVGTEAYATIRQSIIDAATARKKEAEELLEEY